MRVDQFNPHIDKEDVFSVLETLEDNWLTEGKKTAQLEQMLCELTGARHAVMVPNGTLAIFAALKVLGIGPGDEVLVPDFTFFGSASAVILAGATPVLVDVSLDDFTIDVDAADASIGPNTRAIMPVHIYGQSCDMQAVMELARRRDLMVVEGAAQGIGVTCGDKHVGTFGQIGCVSFFADKTITTGEGGALLTDDDELAKECVYFKNQGRIERGSFIHEKVGYDFRITDIQAALGVAQFKRLPEIVIRKREILGKYVVALADCTEVDFPDHNELGQVVPFRVNILVDDAEALAEYLASCEIGVRRFFYPLHMQPCMTEDNSLVRIKPANSMELFHRGLSLPSGLSLTDRNISYVSACIRDFLEGRDRAVGTEHTAELADRSAETHWTIP